jgi:outer membrane protein OmpA-like peptidoglycan-associated protein
MRRAALLMILLASGSLLKAQQRELKPSSPDCSSAVEITDTLYGPANTAKNNGQTRDYYPKSRTHAAQSLFWMEEEGKSAWFRFTVARDTVLVFDIIPVDGSDDYDFHLFRSIGDSTCEKIKGFQHKPVRSCFSYNSVERSRTGIRISAPDAYVVAGDNPPYATALRVKAGQEFYLVIENSNIGGSEGAGFYIRMYNIALSQTIVLENVLFGTNKTTLLPASAKELDKLVSEMKRQPGMKVQISGHTDNVGNESANQVLSEGRAKAVVDYLASKGISSHRLSYKGYGSSRPVADNSSEEGRKKNRRVEMKIISN